MAIFNNALAGAAGQAGGAAGYAIERSLRFDSSASSYLSRTPSSAGNRRTWTWSGWVKRSALTSFQYVFGAGPGSNDSTLAFYADDTFACFLNDGTGATGLRTTAVFRDPSAWYHIVIALDTTQATNTNRLKLYINGLQQTEFGTETYPSLNSEWNLNNNTSHTLGKARSGSYFNGYLTDVHFIDGQALAATDFGEPDDNGVWQPKAYAGSYGTNGFKLNFSDNSSNAALGTDSSTNNNDWTVNNLVASVYTGTVQYGEDTGNSNFDSSATSLTYDTTGFSYSTVTSPKTDTGQANASTVLKTSDGTAIDWTFSTDTTDRYIWTSSNGINWSSPGTLYDTDGGPKTVNAAWVAWAGGSNASVLTVTFADESTIDSLFDSPTNGIQTDTGLGGQVSGNYATWNPLSSSGVTLSNGNLDATNSNSATKIASSTIVPTAKCYWEVTIETPRTGAIGGIHGVNAQGARPDHSGGAGIYLAGSGAGGGTYVNGTQTAADYSASAGDIIGFAFDPSTRSLIITRNGSSVGTLTAPDTDNLQPVSALNQSVGINVNFGQRAFAYTAPTGYKALCTTNLADPTIADGSDYMDVVTYTATGGTAQSITGLEFNPDLVWLKAKVAGAHNIFDSVRGATKGLRSNDTAIEYTDSETLTSFDSNGFSLGTDSGGYQVNYSNNPMVGWAWDAGTSTVSNTDGSITSQVRANPSAGFSIVSWTGTGSAGTIGHGLNSAPEIIIGKNRGNSTSWIVGAAAVNDWSKVLLLNSTAALATNGNFNNTGPTSSVFSVGTGSGLNQNTEAHIAYCWAPVSNYSSFGVYTGNGSTDGPFVYTGFRPAFILIKYSSTGGTDWLIYDSTRDTYNALDATLYPNGNYAETDLDALDFTSNGFKIRASTTRINASGGTFIYACFSENPFKTARAR